MHLGLRAYATYVATVLSFVAQLEQLPAGFDDAEAKVVRLLFSGPYRWISPQVLHNLRQLHFPAQLVDLRVIAVAAKSRVCRQENARHGGLNIHTGA